MSDEEIRDAQEFAVKCGEGTSAAYHIALLMDERARLVASLAAAEQARDAALQRADALTADLARERREFREVRLGLLRMRDEARSALTASRAEADRLRGAVCEAARRVGIARGLCRSIVTGGSTGVYWPIAGEQGLAALVDADDFLRALLSASPRETAPAAAPAQGDVEWVVNDLGELGVKVGGRFFFLYKGESLVYGQCDSTRRDGLALHDDGAPMHWRPVGKREFGECAHPLNPSDPARHGTVSLSDSDEWKPLPAAPHNPQSEE